ncbi:MAG: RHS repeat-associated core domain-containing protein, partial [Acidobacteriota bacterium]|nr:RHS repeat-associated core domain-containing protein [Acidobacteriota bacterium]
RAYVLSSGGQMLAVQSYDGGFYWLHTDHLGNGRKLTNSSGTVIYRAEFDPHGQMLYEWQSSGQTYLNSHKFTGYERDWATNLNYAKARTYNHNRARFMQPDPLQNWVSDTTDPLSFNLYGYVGNDSVNFVDPDGQIPIAAAIIGASALVGGAIEAYRCKGCTAGQRFKAFGIGALAGAISGTAAVFGAAAGTVLGAAVAGGVGGAASTLVGNGLKNGKLTSSDAYQALTSGVVGGVLAGGAQWGANFFFPASNSLNGTNLFSASLSSNSYSSQWSIYKDNLFRLFVSSNISRGLREMGNSVIPNTAAAVLQPLVQPSFDNIALPIITPADYLVPSFADVFGANWNRFLQMAAWSQRIQFLGCYNQGDYRVCVSFQSVGQLGN